MKASMSILSLYQWNPELFDNIVLPEGVNRDLLIHSLVMDCAELELLYPDYDYMKFAIGVWSAKELPIWIRVWNVYIADYNPIENYNRVENETINIQSDKTVSNTQDTSGSSSTNAERTGKVSGYNSDGFVNRSQDIDGGTGETTGHLSNSGNESGTDVHTKNSTISGNIGVTTSQQMIEQELALVPKLNIIDYITKSFKNRFCLLVYT